jgi:folate-dependent phosphoribosylglycinamide formyltransferase PurN
MLKPLPLRIGILSTSRVPGARELLSDPNLGHLFEIACVISTNRDLPERDLFGDAGVPCITLQPAPCDLEARRSYDAATAEYLKIFGADLVILCCYLRLLTAPMLEAYRGRIANLHDSDLALTNANGARRYVGLHSTRDAILQGETSTRATAHWVNEQLDGGPIIARTEPYPVAPLVADARRWGATDILKAQAFAHREWVIRSAWALLMKQVIHHVACDSYAPVLEESA